jgi:uncharacterized membrane protein YfcA
MLTLALAAAIAFVAYVVRGFSGFGSALIMTPLLVLIVEPQPAITSTAILGATIGAAITFQARQAIDWPTLLRPLCVAVPCILLGALALAWANQQSLRRALGLFVILFGARMLSLLRAGRSQSRARWHPRTGYLAGALGGVLGGAFGTGGPPMVVYLENQIDDRLRLRASVLATVLVFDIVRVGSYAATGVFDRASLVLSLAMLPAALLGGVAGAHLHLRVNERTFRATLGLFMVGAGIVLVVG